MGYKKQTKAYPYATFLTYKEQAILRLVPDSLSWSSSLLLAIPNSTQILPLPILALAVLLYHITIFFLSLSLKPEATYNKK
jgi:hypothetical protein